MLQSTTLSSYFERAEGLASEASGVYKFIYKKGTGHSAVLWLHASPQSADDFYELALAIRNNTGYYKGKAFWVGEHVVQNTSVSLRFQEEDMGFFVTESQRLLVNDLLMEADNARHPEAIKQLLLKRFTCQDNIRIWLHKKLETAEELRKLVVHLKTQGAIGKYYRLENPEHLGRLCRNLLSVVDKLCHQEKILRLKYAYSRALDFPLASSLTAE